MTPADRAEEARRSIARALARKNPTRVTLDEIEDLVREAIAEHERAIRRGFADQEPSPGRHSRFL
jgi:hypothetical protein